MQISFSKILFQGPHKRPKEEGPDSPGDEPQLNKRQVPISYTSTLRSIVFWHEVYSKKGKIRLKANLSAAVNIKSDPSFFQELKDWL